MDTNGILGFFGLLAIIVVGIFLLTLLVDWLLVIYDGREGIFFNRHKKAQSKQDDFQSTTYNNTTINKTEINNVTSDAEKSFDDGIDFDKAFAEEQSLQNSNDYESEFEFEDEDLKARSANLENRDVKDDDEFDFDAMVQEKEVVETKQEKEFTDADYDKMIEEIGAPIYAAQVSETSESIVKEELVEENMLNDDVKPETQEKTEDIVEETLEDNSQLNDDFNFDNLSKDELDMSDAQIQENENAMLEIRKALEDEIARLEEELQEQQRENQMLRESAEKEKEELMLLIQRKAEEDEDGEGTQIVVAGSLEELEARLEILRERLRVNEKDLRINKKDYIPLRRVKKTLERDEQKLRRREAMVAKQKVILYGVNNYVDLDEEKAKKLNEDLDLLEGLKLSVAHCEEVMEKNKERYPILENTYNILKSNNEQIKQDIEEVERAIETLKAQEIAPEILEDNSKQALDYEEKQVETANIPQVEQDKPIENKASTDDGSDSTSNN